MIPFNFDRLSSLPASSAGKAAMQAVTSVQFLSAEEQIAGLSLAFLVLIEKYGVHAGNAMQVVGNMLERNRTVNQYVRAVDRYVENEL